ncbi:Phosphoethanolamine-cytidyltransferase [Besnoitia besnoiti]|uniref:ethanolamine-phosphate cytidylyltransferase n=1 Tax=Besnoitia besnoiti TaxID=94643 RepID=A0A2A9M7Q2_BESBE|nr:Phosphoethanolamine-cytidyltransferase [Besnoitia besnoiti]PFH34025.1 Phosphoethanolamine-cytidyltransferase [Besnoitia besnoiti]
MAAVAPAPGLPGPDVPGALAPPSDSWTPSPLPSSSYLHKLIFLYLRINADEALSTQLQHWRASCSGRASFSSFPSPSLSSPSFAGSCASSGEASSASPCYACEGDSCSSPRGEARAEKKEDGSQSKCSCCVCCCLRDPKATAEADAEFSALRAHLLQFIAHGEASVSSAQTSVGERNREGEDDKSFPRTASHSALAEAGRKEGLRHGAGGADAASGEGSGKKRADDRQVADGLLGRRGQQLVAQDGRTDSFVAHAARDSQEEGSAAGVCTPATSGVRGEKQKGDVCGQEFGAQQTDVLRKASASSPRGSWKASGDFGRDESEDVKTVSSLSPTQDEESSGCTPRRARKAYSAAETEDSGSAPGDSTTEEGNTEGDFAVRRGDQATDGQDRVVEGAGASQAVRRPDACGLAEGAESRQESAEKKSLWLGALAGPPHSLSSSWPSRSPVVSCVETVPVHHWSALPPVLPAPAPRPRFSAPPSSFSSLASVARAVAAASLPGTEGESGGAVPAASLALQAASVHPSALPAAAWVVSPPTELAPQPALTSVASFAAPAGATSGALPSRIYVDGVFDLLHSGHFNALRQARQLGGTLVVGVCSDEATFAAKKCRPIYTETERAEIVRGCKWVDEVIVGTPYEVSVEMLDRLNCGFAAHGDDWVVGADGTDAYAGPRQAGRMKLFKRTEGISTSTIVARLLQATANVENRRRRARVAAEGNAPAPRDPADAARRADGTAADEAAKGPSAAAAPGAANTHSVTHPTPVKRFARDALREQKESMLGCWCASKKKREKRDEGKAEGASEGEGGRRRAGRRDDPEREGERRARRGEDKSRAKKCCAGGFRGCPRRRPRMPQDPEERRMLMSTKRLLQFIGQPKRPKKGGKIIYVDGSFDVFHVGHLRILEKARQLGDYLIVGIHDDETVSRVKGPGFPVLNLHERALNVLAMRVVDEVIIGAPWVIPHYMLKQFQIDVVVRGSRIDSFAYTPAGGASPPLEAGTGPTGAGAEGEAREEDTSLPEAAVAFSSGEEDDDSVDPYRVPKELGMYREVESSSSWTTRELVERILANRQMLLETIEKRCSKEANFWLEQDKAATAPMTEL